MVYSTIFNTPVGTISITIKQQQLKSLNFLIEQAPSQPVKDLLLQQVIAELTQYFQNPLHRFNLKLTLQGTAFQKCVWRNLQQIPSGQTMSYGELAKKLQTSPRAIGQACKTNPLPIIIPCHRIVANHELGGFAGHTSGKFLEIKKWLLQHEKATVCRLGLNDYHEKAQICSPS